MPGGDYKWTVSAKCPFFASESPKQHSISCNRGVDRNSMFRLTFSGKDSTRQRYMQEYCGKDYEHCELYRICAGK